MTRHRLHFTVFVVFALAVSVLPAEDETPRFTDANELVRPKDYSEWVFLGASLGVSYEENQGEASDPVFHNVYVNPAAYKHFRRSGEFPEKTIFILELRAAKSQHSINRRGQFEERLLGVEAAVKDAARFEERWAYFGFTSPDGILRQTAPAFPKERCWSCHKEHAATDNVFTQFYPVLQRKP
jgi:hypothetical protein